MSELLGEQDYRDKVKDQQDGFHDHRAMIRRFLLHFGGPVRFIEELLVPHRLHGQKDPVDDQ